MLKKKNSLVFPLFSSSGSYLTDLGSPCEINTIVRPGLSSIHHSQHRQNHKRTLAFAALGSPRKGPTNTTTLDVLKKGTGGWRKVINAFGQEILQDDGEVDRAKLGQIVFSDPTKRQLLNRLLAPFISSGIFWEVFKLWMKGSKVIVLDIPLLFEAKLDRWTKPIIVVWVDPETQLQRLMARDGLPEEQARNRIGAQMALDLKKTKADIVIDNSGSREETKEQFQKVLMQITGPLTWTEFALSRDGALSVLVAVIVGALACRSKL